MEVKQVCKFLQSPNGKIIIIIQILLLMLILVSCYQNPGTLTPDETNISMATNTVEIKSTSTATCSPTATSTKEPTEAPLIPSGDLIYHPADKDIVYDWFSYLPSSLSKEEESFILIGGAFAACPPTDNYAEILKMGEDVAKSYIWIAETEKFIYLLPVIPRPSTNHVYAVSFDWKVFLDSSDPFVQRPDLKVNLMIDDLIKDLQHDGYNVQDQVFIEGFSAGGMFAQRYALLQPDRVKAIAAGQSGGSIIFPESTYEGVNLEWPVGVYDFQELVGEEFDQETYKQIPQLIYIGDQDINNSTLWGTGELWRTQSQISFLKNNFGYSDVERLKNQCEYLIDLGYNLTYKEYEGVGHTFTNEMRFDVYNFFNQVRSNFNTQSSALYQPTPSLSYNIDGYEQDWEIRDFYKSDSIGDSVADELDLLGYSYSQDENYIYILVETASPTRNYSVLDIGLTLLLKNRSIGRYELNITTDGAIWGGNYPENWYSLPIALVVWEDVAEIQIPKTSMILVDKFDQVNLDFISLFTDVDGSWESVDHIE